MKAKEKQRKFSSLDGLADFLNFDFEFGDSQEVKKESRKYQLLSLPASLWAWDPDDAKAANKAKKLHSELKRDLEPIIPPAKADSPTEAYLQIEKLLKKINKMKFQTGWAVNPVDYRFDSAGSKGDDFELARKTPADLEKTKTGRLPETPVLSRRLCVWRRQSGYLP